jgi:50S ribosomal subunit-associated GTPase HflX
LLIDSIGFIEDMHPTIVKAFTATFGEIAHSDVILLFVDASEETHTIIRRCSSMNKILREIGTDGDFIVCANKIDLIESGELERTLDVIREGFIGTKIIAISARTGENLSELFTAITASINRTKLTARLPTRQVYAKDTAKPTYLRQP